MKKIMFFGTSFLGAIQSGFSEIKHEFQRYEFDFYGVNAPHFLNCFSSSGLKFNDNQLLIERELPVFVRKGSYGCNAAGNLTFNGMFRSNETKIDIASYDAVILVDLFYRFQRIREVSVSQEHDFLLYNNSPISKNLFKEFEINGIGGFALKNHSSLGSIPFIRAREIVELFKKGNKNVFLLPAPKPPVKNIMSMGVENIGALSRFFEKLNCIYDEELSDIGVKLLTQEQKTMESDCMTQNVYSRGPHKNRENFLDPHMNADFGKLQFRKLVCDLDLHFGYL